MKIESHKAAIARTRLSRPIQLALDHALLTERDSFFDYGCGQGGDVKRLRRRGINAVGWDPHWAPDEEKRVAAVVNLGFVLNVIEKPQERAGVLRDAWSLTEEILLISVRSYADLKDEPGRPHRDGYLTRIGTFQKFFDQSELKNWVSSTVDVRPVALAPGVVILFRDDDRRQTFVAERFRRRLVASSERRANELYEEYPELVDAFYAQFLQYGRPPDTDEWDGLQDFVARIGSPGRGMGVLRHLYGVDHLVSVRRVRGEDLLVFLALERIEGRPRFGKLDDSLQRDVRAFFGSYKKACQEADRLLFSAGNQLLVDAACRDSEVGKLTQSALFVHRSAMTGLEGVLRVLEGCAHSLVGEIDGANLVKIHRRAAAISYLSYPDFDRLAYPELSFSVAVDLRDLSARWQDFSSKASRPILHRKELMVARDYSGRKKFERLTRQEERLGLLDRPDIGYSSSWNRVLENSRFRVRGHRLVALS